MSTMETTTTTGSSTTEAAKGAASDVAREATSAAADVKDAAKSEVQSVVSEARDRAGEVMHTTRTELRTQATDKTKSLASSLDRVAHQLRSMADKADEPDSPVAQLSRTAADQIRRHSARLEEGGFDGMIDDAKRLARNRPGAFFLGTIAAGFAVGRLAKHADLKQAVTAAKEELTGSDEPSGDQQQSVFSQAPAGHGTSPTATGAPATPVVAEPPLGQAADRGGLR